MTTRTRSTTVGRRLMFVAINYSDRPWPLWCIMPRREFARLASSLPRTKVA